VANLQEERMEELEKLVRRYRDKYDLITLNVGIHGLYTTGKETLKRMIYFAKENELPIHMHYCENQKEVEEIKKDYSVDSPVEVLEDYFANTHTILAHAVKVTESEIRTLSKMKMNVAHCPISNLRLGCRCC
jgi:5-methylthioadenosine/S-adenosylhomocysteine deaminase